MPTITFTRSDGDAYEIEAEIGQSLMHAAVAGGVPGVVGECGGARMCATCHVHIDLSEVSNVPELHVDEDDLLDFAASERSPTSRLSCQIPVSAEMDGVFVTLPERQT